MEMMEIILLIAGGLIFVLSFFIPERKDGSGGLGAAGENEVRMLVGRELESLRDHVDEAVEASVAGTMEKTERSLERLCNEKIMAVNEYSDTVLTEIHKNHEEAVFLYDMLNNKHTALKNTMAEVNGAVKAAEEAIHTLQQLASEALLQEKGLPEESISWEQPSETVQEAEIQLGKEMSVGQETEADREERGRESTNNERILNLYKKGKSAVKIAKELELGIGEVRLVIDLYNNPS